MTGDVSMPYVHIKITREGATAEQKAELIKGATKLLSDVLHKNPATTVVTIEEVDMDRCFFCGVSFRCFSRFGEYGDK